MVFGIDVSHHQGKIDWSKVKSGGIESYNHKPIEFAVLKCIYESEGHREDEQFENNYNGCKAQRINQGVYLFHGSVSLKDPVGEAKALLKVLNGRKLPYGIWHDLESEAVKAVGKQKINEFLAAQDKVFKSAGYDNIGIYCNKYWYDSVLDTKYLKTIYKNWWVARYPATDTGIIKESLSPKDYASAWQFSSKGKVLGINGNVDLDVDYKVNFTASEYESEDVRVVTANKLNVRENGKGSSILFVLSKNDKVKVVESKDGWCKIEGWISEKYIK